MNILLPLLLAVVLELLSRFFGWCFFFSDPRRISDDGGVKFNLENCYCLNDETYCCKRQLTLEKCTVAVLYCTTLLCVSIMNLGTHEEGVYCMKWIMHPKMMRKWHFMKKSRVFYLLQPQAFCRVHKNAKKKRRKNLPCS